MRMSIILAIETSSDIASAALLNGERVIARESAGVQTHSHSILPMVQSLLLEAGLSLGQCDAIAFGCGPGSFTGVRTACGIVQGLAFGQNLPVIPVVTLLAMAQACRAVHGADDVLAVLDARMGEVYWAQYRYDQGWKTITEPTLSAVEAISPIGKVVACGNGLQVYAASVDPQLSVVDVASPIMPRAEHVAQLGQIAMSLGQSVHAREAQPLYLRNKVALTTAERQQKAAESTV